MNHTQRIPTHPLMTRDPVDGGDLLVTRLEGTSSGVAIEGRFSMGWIGKLTQEQLEWVRLLVRNRGNIQKLSAELNVSYNTARSRVDEIVAALGGTPETSPLPEPAAQPERVHVLERLQAGEIGFDEAMQQLKA
ncbi:MAG: DUF2089 domain-containing protein [Chloroflexales bacterium]|nr:DUF2089 domain-containing protein [Chloroflexales bacterium]